MTTSEAGGFIRFNKKFNENIPQRQLQQQLRSIRVYTANGINPKVIDDLKHAPSKVELTKLLSMFQLKPLELIRVNEPIFQQKYKGNIYTDEQWIDIMIQNPELIERPIVIKDNKAIIARPLEKVYELLSTIKSIDRLLMMD